MGVILMRAQRAEDLLSLTSLIKSRSSGCFATSG